MKRDARIDNLRGVLIFLVVLGHLYDTVRFPTSVFQTALIYSFHVPAFAFVSGVCFKYRGQDDRRALKNLLYPYVVFQLVWYLFFRYVLKTQLDLQLTTPYWTQWYLLSMVFWYAAATLLGNLGPAAEAVVMVVAILSALLVGRDSHVFYLFSASRTIVLFPFFYLGVIFSRHESLRNFCRGIPAKILGLVLAAGAGVYYALKKDAFNNLWLRHVYPYDALGYDWRVRGITLALALGIILFLMAWLPGKKVRLLTWVGQNTMPVFILHGFAVKYLQVKLDWAGYFRQTPLLALPACIGAALVLTLLLSAKPVVWLTRPLMRWPFGRSR